MPFTQIDQRELSDIHSLATLYHHNETGAQVLRLNNDDPNKAFTIGFKTPPSSDNGITHIMEHAVLNGSAKYPSKEPFVELIKGSLNTFVNAMTFSDKTLYPVASTNQKDFENLMNVYLDAVFAPNIYRDPQILEQEGWHYHLENADDPLIYKGVVYNEMKGATASPERQLYHEIDRQLYPNSVYRYESGGLPADIPNLTQEEFLEFHDTYYHPSNSFTILYGDLDDGKAFEALENYFAGKGRQKDTVDLSFEIQTPTDTVIEDTYSITAGDDPTDKDYLALAWHTTTQEDMLDNYGMRVLSQVLFGNNQSPLKKALLDAEIGGDISGDFDTSGYPGNFSIVAKYSDKTKMDPFKRVVKDTLTQLVQDGLDRSLITAALNKLKFNLKEAAISESNPRGVLYAITSLESWLYGGSPFEYLQFSNYLDQLSQLVEENYFEELIERKLLNNQNRVAVLLTAEPGKNDELEATSLEKLQDYKSTLSNEELDAIITNTQALIERQETPDSPEDLAQIPTLSKDDLSTEVEEVPLHLENLKSGNTFYHAEQFTSGIDYLKLYFDISDFAPEDYTTLSYLSQLLTYLATDNLDISSLQTQMDTYTGGIAAYVTVYEDKSGHLKPYFVLSGKALEEYFDQLLDLMKEIIQHTQFEDTREMLTITQTSLSDFENIINGRSHVLAASRAMSQFKSSYKLNEAVSGIEQFYYLKEVRDTLKAANTEALLNSLTTAVDKLLNINRLNALYIGSNERATQVKDHIQTAFSDLPNQPLAEGVAYPTGKRQTEAFVTAQDVNYVATASDASEQIPFNGTTNLLSTIIRYDYLWNNIRVKGGAYGTLYNHGRNGSFMLASYRDPNITQTLATYDQLPNFIAQIELSDEELLKYIIGTISPMEQPLSAHDKGVRAFTRYQSGITTEDLVQLKKEIIATTSDDIQPLSDNFKEVLADKTVTVIGNKAQIEAHKDNFDVIYELY